MFDNAGEIRVDTLEEYVRTTRTLQRSSSVLVFSRELIPGLQIDRASPLYNVDFKPLEDLVAELMLKMPEIRVLPLGSLVELIRILALQA